MKLSHACILVALNLVFAGTASAEPRFLAPSDYDPARLLPAPPADGTPAQKAELDELDRIQASRTADDFARAMHDFQTENATIFAEVIGSGFDLGQLPATAKLLGDVQHDEKDAATVAKNFFLRNRPWIADPSLQSCSKKDAPQSSYPSGHSTMGYALGVVLAALVPEKAQAILARAKVYAENRLVCGMHHRSDIVAGQVLGTVVATELLHNTAFREEFDASRQELKAAHLAQ